MKMIILDSKWYCSFIAVY